MEKKVLAVKMKMNLYFLTAAMCMIAAGVFMFLYFFEKREGNFFSWMYLSFAVVMFAVFVYNLVAGIQMCRLPKELIVFENGTLIVFTRRGRADVSLRDVRDVHTDKRTRWYARGRDMFAEHRVILALAQGELRVDMVSDAEAVIKAVTELKTKEELSEGNES